MVTDTIMEHIPRSLQAAKHLSQEYNVIGANFGPGRHDVPPGQFENAVASSPQKLDHEPGGGVRSIIVFGGDAAWQFACQ